MNGGNVPMRFLGFLFPMVAQASVTSCPENVDDLPQLSAGIQSANADRAAEGPAAPGVKRGAAAAAGAGAGAGGGKETMTNRPKVSTCRLLCAVSMLTACYTRDCRVCSPQQTPGRRLVNGGMCLCFFLDLSFVRMLRRLGSHHAQRTLRRGWSSGQVFDGFDTGIASWR